MVAAVVELLCSPCLHPVEAVEHYPVPTSDLRRRRFDPRLATGAGRWINTAALVVDAFHRDRPRPDQPVARAG